VLGGWDLEQEGAEATERMVLRALLFIFSYTLSPAPCLLARGLEAHATTPYARGWPPTTARYP